MAVADKVLQKLGLEEKDKKELDELMKIPKKKDMGYPTSFRASGNYPDGNTHQMDLLFLPEDTNGAKYLLVVTDIGSGATDARALKTKLGKDVLKAVQDIYKSKKYLKKPMFGHFDAGTEFNLTKEWFKKNKMGTRTASVSRHSQMAVIEAMNKIIGSTIGKIQLANARKKQETDADYDDSFEKDWVVYLKVILEAVNNREMKPKKKFVNDVLCKDEECETFGMGDLVRVKLDYPQNTQGKRLHGKFRSGDIRWSIKPHTIENILLYPNQPIRYVVSDIKTNTFKKAELQKYTGKTPNKKPQESSGLMPKYEIEAFKGIYTLKQAREKNRIMVLVSYKGYDERFDRWNFKDELIDGGGGLTQESYNVLMNTKPKPKTIAMNNNKLQIQGRLNTKVEEELNSWIKDGKTKASFMM